MVGGVCSGLAAYFAIDVWLVRLTFIALVFLGGVGLLAYLVLYAVMSAPAPAGVMRADAQASDSPVSSASSTTSASEPSMSGPPSGAPGQGHWRGGGFDPWYNRGRNGAALGILVAVIGFFFLISNLGWLNWWRWDLFWPVVLIALGLLIVARRFR